MGLKGEFMKVLDVISLALKHISREDILSTTLIDSNSITQPTDEQTSVYNDLLSCLNETVQSIAYMYFPLKHIENIKVVNKSFNYSSLSKTLIEVVRLKNDLGHLTKFVSFPTYFSCPDGNYTITYTYSPDYLQSNNQDIEVQQGKVDERILSFGTVSKFYLKRGMYQDANVWDNSFQRLMIVGQRPKHMPQIPSRGWF